MTSFFSSFFSALRHVWRKRRDSKSLINQVLKTKFPYSIPYFAWCLTCGIVALLVSPASIAAQASISSQTSAGKLELTAYDYTGAAFCSLTWNRVEFIDRVDHGRCLQSALVINNQGEANNPTEAGGYLDGRLPLQSSSSIMNYAVGTNMLATQVKMAYWNPVYGKAVSPYVHRKWVYAGTQAANVIDYRVEYEIPASESPYAGQFEVLTGYMPSGFSRFYTLDPVTGGLDIAGDGPGEQPKPLIFSNAAGTHAMGVFSPGLSAYGRWRFADCVKWNVVDRVSNPRGVYRYRVLIVVGELWQVQQIMIDLMHKSW